MKDAGGRLTFFPNLRRYLLALAVVSCAIGLRILLNPILGPDQYPFLLPLGAVAFCSWYCGVLPSILATLAGSLYLWHDFLPPAHSFALADSNKQIGAMIVFLIIAGLIIFLGESHRRVRSEARTNLERLRLAQQAARVGSYEWNLKTGLIRWTPELEALYGLQTGTFGGKFSDWEKSVHPEDIEEAKRRVSEALQKGTFEGEWRIIWPDGSVHWMLGRGYVFNDAAGNPEHMLGVNIDVSDRKEAGKAHSLLAAIVDSSDDVIISKTLDGTITSWNGSAERILGYSSQEAIGQNITLIIPEERWDEEKKIIERIRAGQRVEHFETARRRKDGTLVDLSLTISPVKDAFGHIIGASKVARDISDRKRVELDRQRFITLADRCTEFIGMCDMNYQPFYLNEAALHLIGLDSLDELRKVRVSDFFFPEDQEFVEKEFLPKVLREGKADVEIRFRHFKTGAPVWMIYNVFVIRDVRGDAIAIATFSQNITRRKEMESALRRNEEQLRMVSAELEQKVHARTAELEQRNIEILEQSQQLRELSGWLLKAQDEERRRIARELHDSAGQLVAALSMALTRICDLAKTDPAYSRTLANAEDLVEQLSSEIRTTSYLLHPPLLDEAGLPQAITWYLQGLKERSGLETEFHCSQDFGRLPGNVELTLFRILQECLTNVHRHSGSKSATIRLVRASTTVSMEIQDYGRGMSREKLAAIRAKRGGVGVTGMQERVHQLNGVLEIRSDGPGVTVVVNLPLGSASPIEVRSLSQESRAAG